MVHTIEKKLKNDGIYIFFSDTANKFEKKAQISLYLSYLILEINDEMMDEILKDTFYYFDSNYTEKDILLIKYGYMWNIFSDVFLEKNDKQKVCDEINSIFEAYFAETENNEKAKNILKTKFYDNKIKKNGIDITEDEWLNFLVTISNAFKNFNLIYQYEDFGFKLKKDIKYEHNECESGIIGFTVPFNRHIKVNLKLIFRVYKKIKDENGFKSILSYIHNDKYKDKLLYINRYLTGPLSLITDTKSFRLKVQNTNTKEMEANFEINNLNPDNASNLGILKKIFQIDNEEFFDKDDVYYVINKTETELPYYDEVKNYYRNAQDPDKKHGSFFVGKNSLYLKNKIEKKEPKNKKTTSNENIFDYKNKENNLLNKKKMLQFMIPEMNYPFIKNLIEKTLNYLDTHNIEEDRGFKKIGIMWNIFRYFIIENIKSKKENVFEMNPKSHTIEIEKINFKLFYIENKDYFLENDINQKQWTLYTDLIKKDLLHFEIVNNYSKGFKLSLKKKNSEGKISDILGIIVPYSKKIKTDMKSVIKWVSKEKKEFKKRYLTGIISLTPLPDDSDNLFELYKEGENSRIEISKKKDLIEFMNHLGIKKWEKHIVFIKNQEKTVPVNNNNNKTNQ